ncbi:TolC family protein [Foetidibacter luteolus]|uniref:TolC family protein n=1 Tax=Foetidibacter luteolus TaxID=2608880 RepID=UPI00129A46EC|nr:TolC family protein [Foetidibacter luteolus]
MKKILVLLCAACFSYSHAQQPISLKQILASVESNYPSIKAKALTEQAGKFYVAAAEKDFLPDIIAGHQFSYSTNNGLVGSFYNNEGTTISTSGGVKKSNIYQGVFGSFTTLAVNWRLFTFGRLQQAVNYAKSQQQLAADDYENEVFRQKVEAIDAYLQLALLQKLQTAQQENLERALTFQQYISSRAGAGLLPGADSSYANAEVAKARLALLQSQQNAEQQKIMLTRLSGIATDSITADTSYFLQQLPVQAPGDSISINAHPYLKYAGQRVKAAEEKSLMVKKAVLPTVNLVGMGWARGSGIDKETNAYSSAVTDGIPWQTFNYMGALAVKWNITSLARNKQELKAAMAETQASKYSYNEQERLLQQQLANANLQFNLALQQTLVAPLQYQSAMDAYSQSNARYQAGLATLTDLIQTLYALNRADVDKAVAYNNVWRSLLMKAASSGSLSLITNQLP